MRLGLPGARVKLDGLKREVEDMEEELGRFDKPELREMLRGCEN